LAPRPHEVAELLDLVDVQDQPVVRTPVELGRVRHGRLSQHGCARISVPLPLFYHAVSTWSPEHRKVRSPARFLRAHPIETIPPEPRTRSPCLCYGFRDEIQRERGTCGVSREEPQTRFPGILELTAGLPGR